MPITSSPQSAGVPQGLYEESENQLAALGFRLSLDDGREFVYAQVGGTAAVNGRLYQAPAVDTQFTDMAVATELTGDRVAAVTLGSTAATENMFAEGYLVVTDDTGAITNAGPTYKVSGHPAASASAAVNVTLMDPLWEGIAAASTVTLTKHPCHGVIIHPSPPTRTLVGVPLRDITASYYGWFQTRGICGILQDTAVTVGNPITPSPNDDGAVAMLTATQAATDYIIGQAHTDNADQDVGIFNLHGL